jgi:aspartate aminotransferase
VAAGEAITPAAPPTEVGVAQILAEVARRRANGVRVIPLHSGEPDFTTPAHIVEAAIAALRDGDTHYAPPGGVPELRAAVADSMREHKGLDVDPRQVIVTPGAKLAIHVAMQALCGPGDEIVCLDPSYGAYTALGQLAHSVVRQVPTSIDAGFSIDLEQLEDALGPRSRLLVLNFPCNPTGHVLDEDEIDGIAQLSQRHPRLLILSDEIYARIVYDGATFRSPAAHPLLRERTIVVDGVSKTYAMTGWRVGYAVLPGQLVESAAQVALDMFLCVSGAAQRAAAVALRGPQDTADAMVARYRDRRGRIIDGLNAIEGLHAHEPDGAFYAWVDARSLGMTSAELSGYLLAQGDVATYPGTAFGSAGEGFVRLTFATSEDDISLGLERIAEAVGALREVRA